MSIKNDGTPPLFSIIILSYNNGDMLKEAVSSVLIQEYPKIQLIITDDHSQNLPFDEINRMVFEHTLPRGPIVDFQFLFSDVNTGTVGNLYRGYGKCEGKYVLQFAGDDRLHDQGVISRIVDAFKVVPDDVCALYGISYRCDEHLNYRNGGQVIDPEFALKLNKVDARKQYAELCSYCHFPMGATAFVRERLESISPITDHYKMLEDWPLFLRMTRNSWRFYYLDRPVLDYRNGGVSQAESISPARIQCFADTKVLFEKEIIKNSTELSSDEFYSMLLSYEHLKKQIKKYVSHAIFPPIISFLYYNSDGTRRFLNRRFALLPDWEKEIKRFTLRVFMVLVLGASFSFVLRGLMGLYGIPLGFLVTLISLILLYRCQPYNLRDAVRYLFIC